MPYNVRLKEYGNGTLQLTYYHGGIYSKDDYWKPAPDYDYALNDPVYDYDEDDFAKLKNWVITPFDFDYQMQATELKPDDEYLVLTEEELQKKRDRSLQSSLNRSKRMIYDYGRSNVWEWFITLTFKRVKEFTAENYTECSGKVREWFKNIRKNHCPNIKYLAVPEQHISGAWHFHCLVSNCDELTFEKAVNNQKWRKDENGEYMLDKNGQLVPNKYFGEYLRTSYPDGEYIFNIKQYQNGWSTATKIIDTRKSVSYIVKYITEELTKCTFGKRRYFPSNNLKLPVVTSDLIAPDQLNELLLDIEYCYNCKLSIDQIKTYDVKAEGYSNQITVFEFSVSQSDSAASADPGNPD